MFSAYRPNTLLMHLNSPPVFIDYQSDFKRAASFHLSASHETSSWSGEGLQMTDSERVNSVYLQLLLLMARALGLFIWKAMVLSLFLLQKNVPRFEVSYFVPFEGCISYFNKVTDTPFPF